MYIVDKTVHFEKVYIVKNKYRFLSSFACTFICSEKNVRFAPFSFPTKNVSALALFYRCLHFLAFATGKYPSLRSDSSTPASRKREVSRVLRSYEYFPVMLRSTGACIFLYKKRKLKKNYKDFYISLDILSSLWYYYRRKWNVSKMDGVLRVLGMSVANDAKLFRTPLFQEM